MLRDILDTQIAQPLDKVFSVLEKRVDALQAVFTAAQGMIAHLQQPFAQLQALRTQFGEIETVLTGVEAQINAVSFDFVVDELQTTIDDVTSQLSAIQPQTLLAGLTAAFDDTRAALDGVYPDTAILDAAYQQQVLGAYALLNPQTIIDTVGDMFTDSLALLDQLQISQLFDSLKQRLEAIKGELDDGLDQSEQAFQRMLGALPL